MSEALPDYYSLLGVASSATASEIREAYKRQSLSCHPDRFPNASSSEKQRLTRKFQSLADACECMRAAKSCQYNTDTASTRADYVLSDSERKAEYDSLRATQGFQTFTEGEEEKEQDTSRSFFSNLFGAASAAAGASTSGTDTAAGQQPQGERWMNCIASRGFKGPADRTCCGRPYSKWSVQ